MVREESAAIAAIALAQFPGGDELARILAALSPATRVLSLGSLDELAGSPERELRLVLHVDHVPLEEIGWLRRILAERPGWSLCCTGADAGVRNARALLGLPRSRWFAWPLDLQDFRSLCAPTEPLGGGAAPGLGREHVAALVELAAGMEQAFAAVRGGQGTAALESLAIEVRRLSHYTRTLGGLVEPPTRGTEPCDLVALLDEQLATLTAHGRGGPRFQPAPTSALRSFQCVVRADRQAISVAFETLLHIARRCAGQGETVRVAYTPLPAGELEVRIEFPAGPLAGLSPEELSSSEATSRRLPELWPGELEAAGAFLRSQGGSLRLTELPAGQLAILARFSSVEVRSGAPGGASPTAAPAAAPATSGTLAPAPRAASRSKGEAAAERSPGSRPAPAGDDPFA